MTMTSSPGLEVGTRRRGEEVERAKTSKIAFQIPIFVLDISRRLFQITESRGCRAYSTGCEDEEFRLREHARCLAELLPTTTSVDLGLHDKRALVIFKKTRGSLEGVRSRKELAEQTIMTAGIPIEGWYIRLRGVGLSEIGAGQQCETTFN